MNFSTAFTFLSWALSELGLNGTGNEMSEAVFWPEAKVKTLNPANDRRRVEKVIFGQVALISIAAYISQTLIFDEANWYKIDLYDAVTWGLIVTQVFALAIYVSRNRVQTVKGSLRIFLSMAALSAGLTVAAITFLIVDALRNNREVLPLIGIAPGYCVAVFVFLVAMFLQLRLAIICLQAIRQMLWRTQPHKSTLDEAICDEPAGSETGPSEKYSIADIFAFTGLAAVSISAYRLVLGMLTDYDALRFLAMFYAASVTAFCVYGIHQVRCVRWLKVLLILAIVVGIGYAEFYIAQQLRSPLLRFGLVGMLVCNCVIALATTIQLRFVERLTSKRC